MTVNLTTMSANGQIVIPMAVRRLAKLKPSTQFLVVSKGKDLLLKQVTDEEILREFDLMERIDRTEEEFAAGKFTRARTSMSFKEFDDLLMS